MKSSLTIDVIKVIDCLPLKFLIIKEYAVQLKRCSNCNSCRATAYGCPGKSEDSSGQARDRALRPAEVVGRPIDSFPGAGGEASTPVNRRAAECAGPAGAAAAGSALARHGGRARRYPLARRRWAAFGPLWPAAYLFITN